MDGGASWIGTLAGSSLEEWTPSAEPCPKRLERALAVAFVLEFILDGPIHPGGLGAGAPQIGAEVVAWACVFARRVLDRPLPSPRSAQLIGRKPGGWRFDNNGARGHHAQRDGCGTMCIMLNSNPDLFQPLMPA